MKEHFNILSFLLKAEMQMVQEKQYLYLEQKSLLCSLKPFMPLLILVNTMYLHAYLLKRWDHKQLH